MLLRLRYETFRGKMTKSYHLSFDRCRPARDDLPVGSGFVLLLNDFIYYNTVKGIVFLVGSNCIIDI